MSTAKSTHDEDGAPAAGRGRLARLIATRGGKAAPEAPFVIEHREALIYMLCEAAELEHAIMCQYLFAAFSLKQAESEGLTPDQVAAARRWQAQVSKVATQEMLHLALVHNLLSAIGAAPHLARPNLPAPAGHYPAGVQLALLPFGEQALRHFMFLERPEGMDLADADGLAAMNTAAPVMNPRDIVPHGQDFATVGHLYRSIEAGLNRLASQHGEDWLFVGPARAQATEQHFGWPELQPVTDLASACRAIEQILEQGEGPRGHWRNAHFGQFVRILEEYQQMRAADPAFDPVRPVLAANVRPHERLVDMPLITDLLTARVTDLFNVVYEILLQLFERFFAHTKESDAQLKTLADATYGLMLRVIKPLGSIITILPVGPEYPGRTAGPSFELFYETDYLMPHRDAAWALLAERLDEAAWLCSELCAGRGAAIADQLYPVLEALTEIAGTLAARLPAHIPQSAIAGSLRPGQIAAELDRIRHMLTSSAEGQASHIGDLVAALDSADTGPGQAAAIWAAARAATQLRADLGATGPCPPHVVQATAALQDLALRLTLPTEREARLAELWRLQGGLATSIQAKRNGPYLTTNVPELVNHLGVGNRPLPQLALCRCGGSATKPTCDGACAENGFSDEKDPERVPDHRDEYPGQQLTVFDNRGICQHSGYCSDRLPAVFRTNAEPFVAASGGRMDEIIRAARDCPSGALSYALGGREARHHVDWENARRPAIEVTADGPYRVTGGIPLADADGAPVARAQGSSTEHYALCRCGHSRNKPFCSGMHWYIGFRDPQPPPEPSLFEWAGGMGRLTRMARLLYEKHVPDDPLLAPAFANMAADQPQRLAGWLSEALGGPAASRPREGRHPADPVGAADDNPLTEQQRRRWVSLAGQAADDAGLPADPGFRSAWSSCLEWLSRTAALASSTGADPAPVPRWDWPAGPPAAQAEARAEEEPAAPLPGPDIQLSFEEHIKPLFRDRDRQSMSFAFDLWSADDVRQHAQEILRRLRDGSMPCDGAWPAERIEVFSRWTTAGMPD
jgi:CDGSH-type Zn-finger protein/truncated hemoglobin YjbI